MRPTQYGKIKKLGPGHYKVVWPPKRGPKVVEKRKGRGRHPAEFVPVSKQLPGVKYCRECTLQLNANNTTGLCRGCEVDHKTKRIPDGQEKL